MSAGESSRHAVGFLDLLSLYSGGPEQYILYLIDCIVHNDDMLGHELDNVIYKDNMPYRIDTGASFCFSGGGNVQEFWNDLGPISIKFSIFIRATMPERITRNL